MDRLWAPWRMKYIKLKKNKKCLFCESLKSVQKNYIVFKSAHSFSLLNTFPYNNGHVMVCPRRHIRQIGQLKDSEALDLLKTLNKTKKILDMVLKPHGYNIGVNISASAGAGETRHLHIHIVPRYRGDTNFMTTLYDARVISQSLDELLKQLRSVASSVK